MLFLAMAFMLSFASASAGNDPDPQPGNTPEVRLSESFPEPVDGNTRLLMTKAGNTLMFHFMPEDGIKVLVFDNTGAQKASSLITSKKWDVDHMERGELSGLYEINGDVVIFLMHVAKKIPTLFRIIVDQQTGKVKREDKLAETFKYNIMKGYAMAFGGVDMPEIKVDKDPESGYYAVSVLNSFESDRDERLEIIHYDSTHKEINRAHYDSPNGAYKYITRLGTYVHGDKFVFVCAYGSNTRAFPGKGGKVIISRLDGGTKEFNHKLLNVNGSSRELEAALQYDADDQTLQLLTLTPKGAGSSIKAYEAVLHFIDPEKLTVKHKHTLKNAFASSFGKDHLGYKKPYLGIPQNITLNPDHSITIMNEGLKVSYLQSHNTGSYSTDLGDIGIARYDRLGQEIGGFAVAKAQQVPARIDPLYLYKRQRGKWSFRTGNILFTSNLSNLAFFSYDYINTGAAEYVIFNDYPENFDEKDRERKEKKVRAVSDANAIGVRRKDSQLEKFYLFGEPRQKDHCRFIIVESSARSADGKTFATVMVEKTGKTKKAYVAWINFI